VRGAIANDSTAALHRWTAVKALRTDFRYSSCTALPQRPAFADTFQYVRLEREESRCDVAQRFSYARLIIALAAVLVLPACDDGGGGPRSNALVSSPTAALGMRISPFQLQLLSMTRASCPATQPFTTNFDLVLGPSNIDFFLDGVSLRFGDGFSPFIFFGRDDLDLRFGTRRVLPHVVRSFRFTPAFGCGFTTRPRTLFVTATLSELSGQRHEATTAATIE
jgi:hypothetical protein